MSKQQYIPDSHFRQSSSKPPPSPTSPPSNKKFKLKGLKTTFGTSRTNDDVHHSIKLCPLMKCILDTPHMQRLRGLKQLGVSEVTYVPTTHCRFEHSLGVAALAEKVLLEIAKKQPSLGITEKDIVCVKLAGLMHDIGHGPFSHVYDGIFRSQAQIAEQQGKWLGQTIDPKSYHVNLPPLNDNWEHEDGSLMMIDALLEYLGLQIDDENEQNLDLPLKQISHGIDAQCFGIYDFAMSYRYQNHDVLHEYGAASSTSTSSTATSSAPSSASISTACDGKTPLPNHLVLTSRDWIFIKECIVGGPLPPKHTTVQNAKNNPKLVQNYIGRPNTNKEFLYDIVSNRHSGLDFDKVDYLARDERRAFGTDGQVDALFIENAHVAWGKCSNPSKCFKCKHMYHRNQHTKMSSSTNRSQSKEGLHLMICYPEKMVQNAMNFFQSRFRNHEKLYTHATTNAACYMVCDILLLADPWIKLSTKNEGDGTEDANDTGYTGTCSSATEQDQSSYLPVNGKKDASGTSSIPHSLPISRANLHPESYLRLKDSILDIISANDDPNLKPARVLLNRFRSHKIYKKVAEEAIVSSDGKTLDILWQRELWNMPQNEICSQIVKCGQFKKKDSLIQLHLDDIIVEKRQIHHGMKAENPVNFMRFLPKSQLSKLREVPEHLPIAHMMDEKEYECSIPRAFLQRTVRIYCRAYSRDTCDFLTTCFFNLLPIFKNVRLV